MKKSSPHFVRCIKPNTAKLPDKFTPEYVIAQLRYTGVMETTRIRRQGYPMRLTPDEFLERSVQRFEFRYDFLNHKEKCIIISTNNPSIEKVILA